MKQEINFSEFSKPTIEDWRAAVDKELSGKSFESTMWSPTNGISMQPYYHASQSRLQHIEQTRKEWGIGQIVNYSDEKITNEEILVSLQGGVNFLFIIFPKTTKGVDFSLLFKNVFLEYIEIALSIHEEELLDQWLQFYNNSNHTEWKGAIYLDNAVSSVSSNHYESYGLKLKNFHTNAIDVANVQNRGGSSIDAIVYACIAGKEILNTLIASGENVDDVCSSFRFKFAIETSYFQEIAKLKAFRIIWAEIIKAYNPNHSNSVNTIIDAVSSSFTIASLDVENNLLRSTVEAMAALIGGADTISLHPYNSILEENQTNSQRYARNILHLLKEESYFDSARNAVKGAYYIEELIHQMASLALSRFQLLAELPYLEALKVLDESINASHLAKREDFDKGMKTILGVNKYPNLKDPRLKSNVKSFEFVRLSEILENNLRNSNS